jgi:hypothetical protein
VTARATRTCALLELSRAAFDEIATKLKAERMGFNIYGKAQRSEAGRYFRVSGIRSHGYWAGIPWRVRSSRNLRKDGRHDWNHHPAS